MEFPQHLLNLVRYNLHPTAPANALAIKVFPVPGGPVSKTPRGILAPTWKPLVNPKWGKLDFLKLDSVTARYTCRCLKSQLADVDICFYIPSSALLCAEKASNLQLLTLGQWVKCEGPSHISQISCLCQELHGLHGFVVTTDLWRKIINFPNSTFTKRSGAFRKSTISVSSFGRLSRLSMLVRPKLAIRLAVYVDQEW